MVKIPPCPECGHVNKKQEDEMRWREDDETDIKCSGCGIIFVVVTHVTIEFRLVEE